MKDQSKTKQTRIQKIASLDEASEYAESIIDTEREPLIILDQDLRVVTASRSYATFRNRRRIHPPTKSGAFCAVGKRVTYCLFAGTN